MPGVRVFYIYIYTQYKISNKERIGVGGLKMLCEASGNMLDEVYAGVEIARMGDMNLEMKVLGGSVLSA